MNTFRIKLITNISITLGILLLLSLAIFKIGGDVESNAESISKLNQNLNSRSTTSSEITRIKAVAIEIPPFLDKLKKALPNEYGLIGLQGDINLTAKHHGLGYGNGLKFGVTSPVSAGLNGISFDMNLNGSYENILKFLSEIETNGRFININNIDIVSQDDKYTATLIGIIYYYDVKEN